MVKIMTRNELDQLEVATRVKLQAAVEAQAALAARAARLRSYCEHGFPLSRIFAARVAELGLSVRDVAIRLEVSEARARQILGAKNLREDNIQRVAAALGLRLVLALAPVEDANLDESTPTV